MAGCGTCPDTCNCSVTAGDGVVVTGDGSGANPYLITAGGEDWVGTSPLGSINIGNLAPNAGHTPTLDVDIAPLGGLLIGGAGVQILLDPASTAPVSLGAAGLLINCCPASPPAHTDTPTVDLASPGGILEAHVIPNTLAGLENQAGGVSIKLEDDPAVVAASVGNNLLRFTAAGDLTLQLEDAAAAIGMHARSVTAGVPVSLSNTVGVQSGNSFTAVITNPTIVPMMVRLEGIAHLESVSSGAIATIRSWNPMAVLDISAVAGGAIDVGSNGLFALAEYSVSAISAGVTRIDRAQLAKWAYIPPGGSVTFVSFMQPVSVATGWTTTVGAGGFYQFENVELAIFPAKFGGWPL